MRSIQTPRGLTVTHSSPSPLCRSMRDPLLTARSGKVRPAARLCLLALEPEGREGGPEDHQRHSESELADSAPEGADERGQDGGDEGDGEDQQTERGDLLPA